MSLIVVTTLVGAGFTLRHYGPAILNKVKSFARKDFVLFSSKVSAFGRAAEADVKLAALKLKTDTQLATAKAYHATLDEIHSLLG